MAVPALRLARSRQQAGEQYIKIAQKLCEKWWIQLPVADLAYPPERTPESCACIRDLRWAPHFALLNCEELMARVIDRLQDWIGRPLSRASGVNCHHNYATREEHSGKRVWLSRKGAIDASAGRRDLSPVRWARVGRGGREGRRARAELGTA